MTYDREKENKKMPKNMFRKIIYQNSELQRRLQLLHLLPKSLVAIQPWKKQHLYIWPLFSPMIFSSICLLKVVDQNCLWIKLSPFLKKGSSPSIWTSDKLFISELISLVSFSDISLATKDNLYTKLESWTCHPSVLCLLGKKIIQKS